MDRNFIPPQKKKRPNTEGSCLESLLRWRIELLRIWICLAKYPRPKTVKTAQGGLVSHLMIGLKLVATFFGSSVAK